MHDSKFMKKLPDDAIRMLELAEENRLFFDSEYYNMYKDVERALSIMKEEAILNSVKMHVNSETNIMSEDVKLMTFKYRSKLEEAYEYFFACWKETNS